MIMDVLWLLPKIIYLEYSFGVSIDILHSGRSRDSHYFSFVEYASQIPDITTVTIATAAAVFS